MLESELGVVNPDLTIILKPGWCFWRFEAKMTKRCNMFMNLFYQKRNDEVQSVSPLMSSQGGKHAHSFKPVQVGFRLNGLCFCFVFLLLRGERAQAALRCNLCMLIIYLYE